MSKSKRDTPPETVEGDGKGQYARGLKHSANNGVASAEPCVITGSDDATLNRAPPGQKPPEKDWDLNHDDRDIRDEEFRG
ncbi:hypothetical protein QO002_005746 [Pararhizobium capsulatum DSM 1112]|uniref:Uncharacterized protein n=1 Tax=Pararhizobium capsulatum DSM 1112 TaxID=1121113 RepID=A0ABU0C1L2_9HYPH|nr:hypothetical protein [Pararhizobium capsulatum]MDQ0323540.1 hypothetical protein [Pararhizobium capsulatum DSM 1112]